MDKIKAIDPKIIVNRDVDRPCYSIEYYDTSDDQWHIGYSSYYLENVVGWFDTEFDVVEADVDPVRHGRWEELDEEGCYSCSVCGNPWIIIDGTPQDNEMYFCPYCGAKMDEEENEGESIANDDLPNLALKKLNMTIRELESEYRKEHNL